MTRFKKSIHKSLWAVAVVVVIAIAFVWWHYDQLYPSTDNAYVQTDVVVISAQTSGVVATVNVQNHQSVKAEQLLITLNPTAAQFLFDSNLTALQILNKQQGKSALAKLQIDQAKMSLGQAWLALNATKIYAPVAGTIENLSVHPGGMITAGSPVLAIVDGRQWWVTANFKETQLSRIQPGQAVSITIDMYPHHRFKGVVESIGSSSDVAFSIFPPENASGNWVKVTQRFPVRIRIANDDPHYPLRVGASASVTIDVRSSSKKH